MLYSFLTILFVLAVVNAATLTGSFPKTGSCLCVSGIGVHARSGAGLANHVIATTNTGDCFHYKGVQLHNDNYDWFELEHVSGQNAWIVGKYLTTGTAAQCSASSGGACHDAVAKDLACKILALKNKGSIDLWGVHPSGVHDHAFAIQNIQDACSGKAAARSSYKCSLCAHNAPGGHVCLNRKLLQYIHDLAIKGYIHVNEIAGACHHCNSKHYSGTAVDLDFHRGRKTEYITHCHHLGGFALDEGNHIHCDFGH